MALIASSSVDKTVKLWDAESGECIRTLEGHTNTVADCAFSPDGRIASASRDADVRVWDVDSGECLAVLAAAQWNACAFSPDGHRIAAVGLRYEGDATPGVVKLWDADSGDLLINPEVPPTPLEDCAFSPDGTRFVTCGSGAEVKTLMMWDAESGECLWSQEPPNLKACEFSPDGRRIASGDGGLKVWDAESGESLLTVEGETQEVSGVGVRPKKVPACPFSPDGSRIAAPQHGTVYLWDAETGEARQTLVDQAERAMFNDCAFSPDGRRIATVSVDSFVRVWDVETGECLRTSSSGHLGPALACAFSPEGTT